MMELMNVAMTVGVLFIMAVPMILLSLSSSEKEFTGNNDSDTISELALDAIDDIEAAVRKFEKGSNALDSAILGIMIDLKFNIMEAGEEADRVAFARIQYKHVMNFAQASR